MTETNGSTDANDARAPATATADREELLATADPRSGDSADAAGASEAVTEAASARGSDRQRASGAFDHPVRVPRPPGGLSGEGEMTVELSESPARRG